MKRRKIFNHLHERRFDVILLQETHSTADIENFWKAEWGGTIIYSHGTSNSKGVAILIKKNLNAKVLNELKDDEGRSLLAQILIDGVEFAFTSVYAPNNDDPMFFASAFDRSEQISGRRIIAGDFNTVLNIEKDIKGGKGHSHPKSTQLINEYMEENELLDIWRVQHPDKFTSTFVKSGGDKANILMERIDYILIDSSLNQFVKNSSIMCAFASDHSRPILELQCSMAPPGPGYWKLNVKLLEDKVFVQDVIRRITDVLSDTSIELLERWELMKFSVKQAAIIRGSQINKGERLELEVLQRKLKQVIDQRDSLSMDSSVSPPINMLFNDHNRQISRLNDEIDKIITKRTESAMMRCKAMWHEYAEKPSAYFHALEKRNYNKKTIHRIRNKEGEIVTDPDLVLEELNSYYEKLFSDKVDCIDPDYLATLTIPQVHEKDKHWLDAEIQLEEIHLALKTMKPNKCPGTEGLPKEFYEKFWPMIATTVTKLFKQIVQRRSLNKSAKQSVTSLMGKQDRDPLNISNWRPLSLLNTDYKLFARVLASRLHHTASYLLSHNQKGFMKKRSISDNLLNLLSVVEYCNSTGHDSLLISVDFHSAFDSCSWKAIKEVLNAYGYPEKFIDMIMICYTDIKTAVMNNNVWSRWILQKSGVKQGCPLSGLLFNHLISIIEMKIEQNSQIEGITIPGCPTKKVDVVVR